MKLSGAINSLRTNVAWLEENIGPKFFVKNSDTSPSRLMTTELRVAETICSCVEMFFLQDSASDFESLVDRLGDAINEKAWEVHSVCEEIREGIISDSSHYRDNLFSIFFYLIDTLEPLFQEALDKFLNSSQSKNCTIQELLEIIHLLSEDIEGFGSTGSLKPVQHKLEILKIFVSFAASKGFGQEELQGILAHAEFVVITTVYYLCMNWIPDVVDGTAWSAVQSRYSGMLKVQPDIRETYIMVLKASKSSSSSDYTMMDDNIVGSFFDYIQKIHRRLLGYKDSGSSSTLPVVKILIEELRFLRNFFIYQRQEEGVDLDEEMDSLLLGVVIDAGLVIYSLSWDDLEDDFTNDADAELVLFNWMEEVQLLKDDIKKKYPQTLRYKFPRINELGFMDGLLTNLKELIRYPSNSISFAHGQMDVVLEDLVFLRDFLQDTVKQSNEHEELKALWIRIIDIAYKTEFVINSLVVGDSSPDCSPTSFNSIKDEIKMIKTEVKEIYREKKYEMEANPEKIFNHLQSRSSNSKIDEVIVGLEDDAEEIIDRLQSESAELDIISIVGMSGQGKTTLAKKVYNNSSIKLHFHVCAWCCVSKGYQKRNLLLDILSDTIDELSNELKKKSVEDLEKVLYQSLRGRRYLIVLDDIWDIEAWKDLKLSFPDDHNYSRILLTSQLESVVLKVKPDGKPHYIRLLNDTESRELLQKTFHNEGWPLELEYLEAQVVKSCKGLPLAIVTIAGILANLEQDSWEDFAEDLSTTLVSGMKLFEFSYTYLPDYLKPCLLYFGSFLEDKEIPVSRLIWLWMAEGFVQKTTNDRSLENVAEEFLGNLISRSLVMVVKQKSRGGIKACKVHDLVHQFCVTKAKEENFLQPLNLHEEPSPLSEPRRLCIQSKKQSFHETRLCFRHLSSLIFSSVDSWHAASTILCNFKLLKVLDLKSTICSSFPAVVEKLVLLRYLAIAGEITYIPSTIVKLWNLETFLLRGIRGEILLPYGLLSMKNLRHLHVNNRVVFSLPKENLDKCSESCNLETFSTPLLSSGQDMVKIIKKMQHLWKLKCTFFGSWSSKEGYQFPALNFLSQLESLKVHSTGKVRYQLDFCFPLNIKKLTLSNFYLPWTSISRFQKLPNLEVLKLLNKACEGETWDMDEEEEFKKLQFLKLENLDIVHWDACSGNFPSLQQLILHKCRKLQGLPSNLEEVVTLQIIEVKWCHHSVASSAQSLEEEVEGLKATIHPPDLHNKFPAGRS